MGGHLSFVFRATYLPDIEEDPVSHKLMNQNRMIITFVQLIFASIAIPVLYHDGYDGRMQLFAIVWLFGNMFLRMFFILGNFFPKPFTPFYARFLYAYFDLVSLWQIMGIVSVIMSVFYLDNKEQTPGKYMWMIIFIFFLLDVVMIILFHDWHDRQKRKVIEKENYDREEQVERNRQWITQQAIRTALATRPGVQTHRYYTECAICYEKFTEDDMVKELACKHIYHPACIDEWLTKQNKCAICNNIIN